MKPTINEEIEMSNKGIDYVNSLVPKTPTRNTNFAKQDIDKVICVEGRFLGMIPFQYLSEQQKQAKEQ